MLPAIHDTGTGAPVLFLHAFTLDASQWDHQVAALSDDMRCIRVDLWGCGSSPAPPAGEPALDGFAAAVLAALDSLNIDKVAVVGLSMGGYLAFTLWRLAPQRIRAPALCNNPATAASPRPGPPPRDGGAGGARAVGGGVRRADGRADVEPGCARRGTHRRPRAGTDSALLARGHRLRAARDGRATRQHRAARVHRRACAGHRRKPGCDHPDPGSSCHG